MRRITKIGVLACSLILPATTALAGPYSDDLAKCLVKSASDDDKITLMKWFFVALAQHPTVRPLSNINDSDRNEATNKAGALFERLVTKDCRAESVAALKYEGLSGFESSFSILGQIAVGGLMKDPAVQKEVGRLNDAVDSTKFDAIVKEAGITVDPDAPPKEK